MHKGFGGPVDRDEDRKIGGRKMKAEDFGFEDDEDEDEEGDQFRSRERSGMVRNGLERAGDRKC
jgi:hypothetical protein